MLAWAYVQWYEFRGAVIIEREHAEEEEAAAEVTAAASEAIFCKAARRMGHLQIGAAFGSWQEWCVMRQHKVQMLHRVVCRLQYRQLACVFSGWILRTAQTHEMAVSADAEKMTANLVQQLDARSSELRQAHLAGVANEHHRQERMVAIGVARLRSHARAATFYAWLA